MSSKATKLNDALMKLLELANNFDEVQDLDRKLCIEAMALIVSARDEVLDQECV